MTVIEFFGDLPDSTKRQLDCIENHFGHKVFLTQKDDQDDSISAYVDDDGVPTVAHKQKCIPDIPIIVHEVWHLYIKAKLRIKNYNFRGELEVYMTNYSGSECKYVKIFYQLYSAAEHFFFLKEMDPKYHPYLFIENSLNEIDKITKREFSNFDLQQLSLNVVQTSILFQSPGIGQKQLIHLKEICPEAYKIGNDLLEILKEFDAIDKEPDIIQRLVKILWHFEGVIKHVQETRTIWFESN